MPEHTRLNAVKLAVQNYVVLKTLLDEVMERYAQDACKQAVVKDVDKKVVTTYCEQGTLWMCTRHTGFD